MPKSFDRMTQVNKFVRNALATEIPVTLELAQGEIVTVTRVLTSRDLGHAKVFVTIYPDKRQDEIFARLEIHAKHLRHEISQKTRMFRIPELRFLIDETEKHAQAMDALLDSIEHET